MSAIGDEAAALMGRPKDIDDNAVPSGNAVALHALARLQRRPGEKRDFLQADEHANALLTTFATAINNSPSAYPYFLLAAAVLADGQSGSLQSAARGNVAISGRVQNAHLSVNIAIQPGWHINAHQPLSDELIPTVLQAAEAGAAVNVSAVSYPPPKRKKLGFQSEELALYEGNISLTASLSPGAASPPDALLRLELQLQACDDEVCLPPERVQLQFDQF
jgi:DsbC/DsbD-like thiol-disulfide interchange protein